MTVTVLTFVSRVLPSKLPELRALLAGAGDPASEWYIPFKRFQQVHFAGFIVFDSVDYEPYLVFENNFDGDLTEYLTDLCAHSAKVLHEIYCCTMDYAVVWPEDRQGIVKHLLDHMVAPSARYVGNVGLTAARIRQESVLRSRLEDRLDDITALHDADAAPELLRLGLQKYVRTQADLAWAATFQPRQTAWEKVHPWLNVGLLALAILVFLPVVMPVFIVWLIVLRRLEARDPSMSGMPDDDQLNKLLKQEADPSRVQNHLASLIALKPGWFRRTTLRAYLWVLKVLARTQTHGQLGGIPSIHFAHWSILDKDRLLFLSNYDGSWENYLDDFIDKAAHGLTGVWSNTIGFPPTRFLILEGAVNGPRFKAFARVSQSPTNFWYPAYETLTVQNIDTNSLIREGLFQASNPDQIRAWLRLF